MHAIRLIAEGVGPFEKLDLDLSDGKGNPHLGPHILVGANGSGKSTALRAIAWALGGGGQGFPRDEWRHALAGRDRPSAFIVVRNSEGDTWVQRCEAFVDLANKSKWNGPDWASIGGASCRLEWLGSTEQKAPYMMLAESFGTHGMKSRAAPVAAAYTPTPTLGYVARLGLDPTPADTNGNALAFERTVRSEVVQNWLLGLFSRSAIAEKRGETSAVYTESLRRFETALHEIFQEDLRLDVDLEPEFQLFLKARNQRLNFSQLPDGIRTVLGWLADFMMRQERKRHEAPGSPSILVIDEIDAHLHPRWQRQILPAIKQALPDVQIIVSTHSPFIVNSCAGARVHVLEVDEGGRAHALPPVDAPFGQSFNAALKDVFQVESRFDLRTEKELHEWNTLNRKRTAKKISDGESKRFLELSEMLASRSEELRFLVSLPPVRIAPSAVRTTKRTKNGTARPGR